MIVLLGHIKGAAIDQFVFEEDHRIFAADRRLEQALGIAGIIRRDDDQAGNAGIPRSIVLAMLRTNPAGGTIRPAKHDRTAHLAA